MEKNVTFFFSLINKNYEMKNTAKCVRQYRNRDPI